MSDASISTAHRRRLREVYRSAGWPCRDTLEIELLAAGLLERVGTATGPETVRVTDAGIGVLAETLQRNRSRRDAHERLVESVAHRMVCAGRIAWRGLSLRAKVGDAWTIAMPDVFSIRHTSVEARLEPMVHEVKVQRSDLLADLRNPAKRAAYLQLGSECWYVIRAGIARPDEIPAECGVMIAGESTGLGATGLGDLEIARPAPRRALPVPFGVWMALARATPLPGWRLEDAQCQLGDTRGFDSEF